MTVYAPSDISTVSVPADRGGCGEQHGGGDRAEGDLLAVDCAQCEPVLLSMTGHGYAADPLHVALTPDERRAADALQTKAQMEQQKTWSSPQAFGAFLAAAGFNGAGVADGGDGAQAMLAEVRAMRQTMEQQAARIAELEAKQAPAATPAPAKKAAKKAAPAAPPAD